MAENHPMKKSVSIIILLLLSILIIFIRFYQLEADPDTTLTWSGVFYTDEGWHTENSVSKYTTGKWIIPGSANHILLLPFMPSIDYIFIKALGLSLWTLRVPSVICCLLSIGLLWVFSAQRVKEDDIYSELSRRILPLLCLFIIGFNYYFFIYGRLALLDIPMAALGLCSLFFVYRALLAKNLKHKTAFYISAGVLLAFALLTKTTAAIFVVTLIFVLILQLLADKTSRKSSFWGISSVIVIGFLVYLTIYKSLPYLLSAADDVQPVELISVRNSYIEEIRKTLNWTLKEACNPTLFWVHINGILTNLLILRNQVFFWLAATSLLLVVVQSYRQKKVNLTDNIMGSLFVASFLFLGYFRYQPPRYLTILIMPVAYFVSMLPQNLLSISQISLDKRKDKRLMLTIVIIIFCANIPNVLRVIAYHKNPRYSIVTVAGLIEKDIVKDNKIPNVEDIRLVSNLSIFSAINKIKILYEFPIDGKGPIYLLSVDENYNPNSTKEPSLHPLAGKDAVPVASYNLLNNYKGRLYLYRKGGQ